jgi:hypothetical protein
MVWYIRDLTHNSGHVVSAADMEGNTRARYQGNGTVSVLVQRCGMSKVGDGFERNWVQ